MKTSALILSISSLTIATPVKRDASDMSNDMDSVIAGRMSCASNAVVFGRGTFDSGNMGVWVGPFLKDSLHEVFNGDVHVQGVNEADYPANLVDYVKEGGSERCADACARTVDNYISKCPGANIFVSGWRYGLLLFISVLKKSFILTIAQPGSPLCPQMRQPSFIRIPQKSQRSRHLR